MPFCASSESSEDSGECAHLHRLTLAFVTIQKKISRAVAIGDLSAIHTSSEDSGEWSLDNAISIKISYAGSEGFEPTHISVL